MATAEILFKDYMLTYIDGLVQEIRISSALAISVTVESA